MSPPTLETRRLVLRPLAAADAADVRRLAGERAVADTTRAIPHPYEDGMAEKWIAEDQGRFERGEGVTFAVTLRDSQTLIGCIGLTLEKQDERAELGYWIGKPYWNCGYASEAAAAVVEFGFEALKLHRICARCLRRNPASARILRKVGMSYEGCLVEHMKKWGRFEDLECYGVVR